MEKGKPKVSIIITTYNRSKILETTLKSVLAQTYKNIEVFVIDDGSTDDTPDMLKKYSSRVKYIRQQNQGVEAARKKGVQLSSGDYINFLDDDDLMKEDKIEKQVEAFIAHPEAGIVHCGYYFIDEDGNYMDRTGWLPDGDVRLSLVWGCFPWSGGPLIRREMFKLIADNEPKIWYTDWGMWLRFTFTGINKWECVQEPLGYYRMVRGSMTDDKVAIAENVVFTLLDYVYTNYQLTDEIIAEKNQLYAGWYSWISCRYYAGGYWEDGKRTLSEIVKWNKELIEQPQKLLELLYNDAVTPRVRIHDPLKHINDIFDHLPDELEFLNIYRDSLLDRISANLVMKCYGNNNTTEIDKFINRLIKNKNLNSISPNLIYKELESFIVTPHMWNPFSLIKKIRKKLEPFDEQLSNNFSDAVNYLAEANIFCSFENYLNKNWKLLFKRILIGFTNHPFVHTRITLYLIRRKLLRIFKNHNIFSSLNTAYPESGTYNADPLVSVVIPTYNKSNYLRQTIESVLNQTYKNIEIIVVDDGSTDDTEDVVRSFGNRIKFFKQHNTGGTPARNKGIQMASGKYINLLDHDDLLLPDKIERQVHYLESDPEIGMVHCRYYFIDENGKRLAKVFILSERNIFRKILLGCFIWSGAPLIRKSCLDKAGNFDENVFSSDWDMWLRIAQTNYKIKCIQQPLGEYRVHHDSAMKEVFKTEYGDVKILDKVFNNGNLSPRLMSLKNEIYGRWRLWLSLRYYATGLPDEGKRNLNEALTLFPAFVKNKEGFFRRICDEAVDFRVSDPLCFVENVFNNLPGNAGFLSGQKSVVLSLVYLRLALRDYGNGDIVKAKLKLSKAVELNPGMISKTDEFLWTVFVYSIRLAVDPYDYINRIFNNLPVNAIKLKKLRRKIIAHIQIAMAYENLATGHSIFKHFFDGMKNRPSLRILFKTWMYYT